MPGGAGLGVEVLPVGGVNLPLLQQGEVEEVRGAMDFVVKLLGVGELQLVLHVGVVANTWKRELQLSQSFYLQLPPIPI